MNNTQRTHRIRTAVVVVLTVGALAACGSPHLGPEFRGPDAAAHQQHRGAVYLDYAERLAPKTPDLAVPTPYLDYAERLTQAPLVVPGSITCR